MPDAVTATVPSRLPTAIDPDLADELSKLSGFTRTPKKTLDQSDFLQLLTAQLVNQDPLEPQKDTEFIAQMTTFNSAEQMSQLVTSMKSFITAQGFSGAQNYLGKWVTLNDGSTQVQGYVSGVGQDDDGAAIVTIGTKDYAAKNIVGVRLTAPGQNSSGEGTTSSGS